MKDYDEKLRYLYKLQEEMQQIELLSERSIEHDNLKMHENLEEEHQCLYEEYWNIMVEEIDPRYRRYVEDRIGNDHFTDKIYLDELTIAIEADRKTIDEYQGYRLTIGFDPFGRQVYWIFDSYGNQVEESFEFIDDGSAILYFHEMIDDKERELEVRI